MDESRTNESLHELARLYLTPPEADPPQAEPNESKHGMTPSSAADRGSAESSPSPRIVLVGHLPGFANLWINQYAQQLCESRGPVGVLHIADDSVDLDLFQPGLPTPVGDPGASPTPESLPEAINAIAGTVRQWLVHLADPQRRDLRGFAGELQHWTLLTGADEAAIVAAYRLLKQWVEPAGYPDGDPSIELAFLGCEASAAEDAAQRIQRTAGQFMDVAITVGQVQPKMQPVNRRRIGTYDPPQPISDLLDLLIVDQPFELHLADEQAEETETTGKPEMTPSSAADRGQPAPSQQPTPERPVLSEAEKRSAEASDSPAPGLAGYVPDLTAIIARCPHAEAVELALDPAGRLHLLLDAGQLDADPLATLLTVQTWAAQHANLLAMTIPDRDFAGQSPATLHLFTAEPKRFASLNPSLKLHLLLPVTIGDATTLTHVELN